MLSIYSTPVSLAAMCRVSPNAETMMMAGSWRGQKNEDPEDLP